MFKNTKDKNKKEKAEKGQQPLPPHQQVQGAQGGAFGRTPPQTQQEREAAYRAIVEKNHQEALHVLAKYRGSPNEQFRQIPVTWEEDVRRNPELARHSPQRLPENITGARRKSEVRVEPLRLTSLSSEEEEEERRRRRGIFGTRRARSNSPPVRPNTAEAREALLRQNEEIEALRRGQQQLIQNYQQQLAFVQQQVQRQVQPQPAQMAQQAAAAQAAAAAALAAAGAGAAGAQAGGAGAAGGQAGGAGAAGGPPPPPAAQPPPPAAQPPPPAAQPPPPAAGAAPPAAVAPQVTGSHLAATQTYEGGEAKVDLWIRHVERNRRQFQWNDQQTAAIVKNKLIGAAAEWLDMQERLNTPMDTWTQLRPLMEDRFRAEINPNDASNLVTNLKQRAGEKVNEFYDRVVVATDKKNFMFTPVQKNTPEYRAYLLNDVFIYFKIGLDPEIKANVESGTNPATNAAELLAAALHCEKSRDEKTRRNVSEVTNQLEAVKIKDTQEAKTKMEGETEETAHVEAFNRRGRGNSRGRGSSRGRGRGRGGPKTDTTCFTCGGKGHYSFNCPSNKNKTGGKKKQASQNQPPPPPPGYGYRGPPPQGYGSFRFAYPQPQPRRYAQEVQYQGPPPQEYYQPYYQPYQEYQPPQEQWTESLNF